MNKQRTRSRKAKSKIIDAAFLNPSGKHTRGKVELFDNIKEIKYLPQNEDEAKMLDQLGLPYPEDWKDFSKLSEKGQSAVMSGTKGFFETKLGIIKDED